MWDLRIHAESARLQFSTNLSAAPPQEAPIHGRTPGPIPVRLSDGSLHLVDPERLTEVQVLQTQETNMTVVDWKAGRSGHCWAVTERLKGATPRETLNKAKFSSFSVC